MTEEEQPQRSEQTEQPRKEGTEQCKHKRILMVGRWKQRAMTQQRKERRESSYQLLSDIINIHPSASFRIIPPHKKLLQRAKAKDQEEERIDYFFESFTPIAIQKHKHYQLYN